MFAIIINKFFRKMKLGREIFEFKYVSEEMSNLSLAPDYKTVLTIQGTFSCLLYIFANLLLSDFINLTQVHNFTVSAQDIFTFRRPSVFTVSFTRILQVLTQIMKHFTLYY